MKQRTLRALSISTVGLAAAIAAGSSACGGSGDTAPTYVMGPVNSGGSQTTTGGSSTATAGTNSPAGGSSSDAGSGATAGGSGPSGGSEAQAGTAPMGGSGSTGGSSPGGGETTGGSGGSGGSGAGGSGPVLKGHFKVLAYHETRGYAHGSIKDGMTMLKELAMQNDFEVSESDGDLKDGIQGDVQITAAELAPFDVVFFMNPTGDIFTPAEKEIFKTFLHEKKSFAGVHATTDTEHSWTWYEDLVGEIYDGHSAEGTPSGTVNIEESQKNHPAMAGIASPWTRNEEWYKFTNRINNNLPGVTILMRYGGGASTTGPAMGQPLAWTRCWEGIRSFYTAMGHDSSAYKEPLFRKHVLGGLLWAARRVNAPNETCP